MDWNYAVTGPAVNLQTNRIITCSTRYHRENIRVHKFKFLKSFLFLPFFFPVSNPPGCKLDFGDQQILFYHIHNERIVSLGTMQTWKHRPACGSRLSSPLNTPSQRECSGALPFNYNCPINSVAVENLPSQSECIWGLPSYVFHRCVVHKLDIVSLFHSLIGVYSIYLP